jgi:hypothetical protein
MRGRKGGEERNNDDLLADAVGLIVAKKDRTLDSE